MDSIIKWVRFISALIGILGVVFNLLTGWPFNPLLVFSHHQLLKISSTNEFKIETVQVSSGRAINPPDKFSYRFHLPLQSRGITSLDASTNIWVILQDEHGGYYMQSSLVEIKNGQWRSYNIRPLHGIKRLIWLKVDTKGHSFFLRKRDSGEWGKFINLPFNSIEVGYVDLR